MLSTSDAKEENWQFYNKFGTDGRHLGSKTYHGNVHPIVLNNSESSTTVKREEAAVQIVDTKQPIGCSNKWWLLTQNNNLGPKRSKIKAESVKRDKKMFFNLENKKSLQQKSNFSK